MDYYQHLVVGWSYLSRISMIRFTCTSLPPPTRFCKTSEDGSKRQLEDTKRQKVALILDRLITLTIEEEEMYPSIQAKIWGSIGQVGDDGVISSTLERNVHVFFATAEAISR